MTEEGGEGRGKEQKDVKRRSLERDAVQEAVIKTIPPHPKNARRQNDCLRGLTNS